MHKLSKIYKDKINYNIQCSHIMNGHKKQRVTQHNVMSNHLKLPNVMQQLQVTKHQMGTMKHRQRLTKQPAYTAMSVVVTHKYTTATALYQSEYHHECSDNCLSKKHSRDSSEHLNSFLCCYVCVYFL